MDDHYDTLRNEVIKLATNKEIPYSVAKIKKMSHDELENIYNDFKMRELDELNEAFADILISKFDKFMKTYKWVSRDSTLGKKLQDKKLFKNDFKNMVSYVTPFLPFIGLVEGSLVVASEVIENKYDVSHETPQGDEQNSTPTEPN